MSCQGNGPRVGSIVNSIIFLLDMLGVGRLVDTECVPLYWVSGDLTRTEIEMTALQATSHALCSGNSQGDRWLKGMTKSGQLVIAGPLQKKTWPYVTKIETRTGYIKNNSNTTNRQEGHGKQCINTLSPECSLHTYVLANEDQILQNRFSVLCQMSCEIEREVVKKMGNGGGVEWEDRRWQYMSCTSKTLW